MDGWTDNVKTVYQPKNTVCGGQVGGYKEEKHQDFSTENCPGGGGYKEEKHQDFSTENCRFCMQLKNPSVLYRRVIVMPSGHNCTFNRLACLLK